MSHIHPLPYGSQIKQITRGKNAGKYAVFGLYFVQNSLMRFADTPLYVIRNGSDTDIEPGLMKNCSRVFSNKTRAEEFASKFGGTIDILTLTIDQIIR